MRKTSAPAVSSSAYRSSQNRQSPKAALTTIRHVLENGAPGEIRTPDHLVRRASGGLNSHSKQIRARHYPARHTKSTRARVACGGTRPQGNISPFPHAIAHGLHDGAKEVFDHPAPPGLDLHRYDHARRQRYLLAVFHAHGGARHDDTRAVEKSLDRFLHRHGVSGKTHHLSRNRAVAGEGERLDLDLCILALAHEADVSILDIRLYFHASFFRGNHHQLLRW